MRNVLGLVVSFVFIGIVIIAAKFFEKTGEETSRKFIHIMLANWWFIAMYFFKNTFWASIGPACFIIINYLSYKKNLIKVMERDEPDGLGTVYYAISLFLMVIYTFGIIKKPEIGLCATLIMGYGDGLAAVMGQSIKSYEFKVGKTIKTIAGSLTMLIISGILVSAYLISIGTPFWYFKALAISLVLTIVEAISIKGTDNLTVPIIACLLLSIV